MSGFRDEVARATARAFATAQDVARRDLGIAGVPVRFRASDPDLLRAFTASLRHHPAGPARDDSAAIDIWSATATGVARPAMPAQLQERIKRRAPDFAPGADHQIDYDPSGRMLTVMDPATGNVTVCLNDLDHLPAWERAAPLRSALGWILRRYDRHLVHAAAVSNGHGAALLVGAGGAGKSTTSLRCRQAGMGFLGDDICAFQAGNRPRVFNVYGTAKTVWQDVPHFPELGGLLATDPAHREYKAVFDLAAAGDARLVDSDELRVVVLVDRTHPVGSARPASPAAVAAVAASSTASFLPGSGQDMLAALSQTIRTVPVITLSVGTDPVRVAQLVDAAISDPRAVLAGAYAH